MMCRAQSDGWLALRLAVFRHVLPDRGAQCRVYRALESLISSMRHRFNQPAPAVEVHQRWFSSRASVSGREFDTCQRSPACHHDPHGARIDACGDVSLFTKQCRAVRRSLTATASHAHAQRPPLSDVSCGHQTFISVHHEATCRTTSRRGTLSLPQLKCRSLSTRPAPPPDVRKTVYDHGATRSCRVQAGHSYGQHGKQG
jgi:hypothetical protein